MHVFSIVLQILLGLAFLMSGFSKISGSKMQVDAFDHLRLPQWFRVVTGLVQLIGVVGLIVGIWVEGLAFWAGLWFAVIMFFALMAHIRVKDPVKALIAPFVLMVEEERTALHNNPANCNSAFLALLGTEKHRFSQPDELSVHCR
jgi:uncharacterized membrane protein YphA (DoxX/SURF4 family)